MGYRCFWKGKGEVNGFRRPDILVELHTDYFSEQSEYYGLMELSFCQADPSERENITELYLYSILHVAKHYFAGGCGIRRVLDMYFLDAIYGEQVDHEYVNAVLEKAGVFCFAEEFLELARTWFGIAVNETKNMIPMERYILDAGLHGKRENYINSKLRRIEKGAEYSFGSKIRYLLGRLFPGDRTMLRHYPILRKCGVLYPFCWIHRFFCMLLGKKRKASLEDLKLVLKAKHDFRTNVTVSSNKSETDHKN